MAPHDPIRTEAGNDVSGNDVTGIEAAIDALMSTLVVARALVQAGVAVDLAGLDREISDLCAGAVALPRPEAREMATPLADLLTEVEHLERALERKPPGR